MPPGHAPTTTTTPAAKPAATASSSPAEPHLRLPRRRIASPTNGTLPPHTAYPSSTATPTSEGGKRKRGRPRKYATPEEAAAARKALLASSIPKKKKKDKFVGGGGGGGGGDPSSFSVSYSKKTPVAPPGVGNVGQGFTPNTLNVAAGELSCFGVYQKIMLFMQQSKSEICILSASGSISNPSLRQPATFGGNITYEVIVGTFVIDATGGMKGDASFPKFQSPVGGSRFHK
ncbi:hypothetical protein C3L33_16856, partial [Rhododendron williamsianum]